ncbi:MAG: hypothetical protein QOG21_1042, partial [Actinomycetota bacterium]|nr:hypothetical protein [Actinomycetota bacterium]
HFAVGFGDEPAYAGQKNSVQLFLHDQSTDKPIVNLGPTLKVQVAYGSQKMPPITMEPDFEIGESGIPGDYRGWFIPTRPGRYSFHFTGSIRGQKVNETFKSGATTFSNVEDPQGVEFPAKDPTVGQLNDLVGRETTRLNQAVAAARSDASSKATTARNFALVAVALGVVALALAVGALRRNK